MGICRVSIKLGDARGDVSIINFGPLLRADKEGRYELFRVVIPRALDDTADLRNCEMLGYMKGPIPHKGRLRLNLPLGERFLLIAQGYLKAGQVNTAEHSLIAPFFVTIDAEPSNVAAVKAAAKRAGMTRRNPISRAINSAVKHFPYCR
jgi:hypothetical protein